MYMNKNLQIPLSIKQHIFSQILHAAAVACYAGAAIGAVAPCRPIVTILEETSGKRKRSFLGHLKMELRAGLVHRDFPSTMGS